MNEESRYSGSSNGMNDSKSHYPPQAKYQDYPDNQSTDGYRGYGAPAPSEYGYGAPSVVPSEFGYGAQKGPSEYGYPTQNDYSRSPAPLLIPYDNRDVRPRSPLNPRDYYQETSTTAGSDETIVEHPRNQYPPIHNGYNGRTEYNGRSDYSGRGDYGGRNDYGG
ncbi:hypothetical protein HK096_003614, partial [Nowakowskiella sp. JEL0078]